ncbi:MAG: hypothetical protein U1E73_05000 [Planctomycetota bacterium]
MRRHALRLLLVTGAACAGAPSRPPEPPAPVVERPPAPEQPPVVGTQANGPTVVHLGSGLTVFAHPYREGSTAVVQIGFRAGSDSGAPAAAELAAACLVDCADATAGRPSLRQAIAGLGGSIGFDVEPSSTWVTLLVPRDRWLGAQRHLAATLAAPPASRSQIERIRDEYVLRRIQQVWSDRDREVARAFQLGYGSTSGYVGALLDRDPSEISLFAARAFRPDLATLVLRVPMAPATLAERLADGMASWSPPDREQSPLPVQVRRLESGLYWSANPAPISHVVVLLPLPETTQANAAEAYVLHACLTLDGVGGRLEQLLQRRGMGHLTWSHQYLQLADVPALALTTDVAPAEAPLLWLAIQEARRSLRDLPPTASELALALRRAALLPGLVAQQLPQQLRERTMLALRDQAGSFERRLQQLAAPGVFDAAAASEQYLRLPAAMIVLGGAIPATVASACRPFDLLPTGALARLASPDPVAQAQVATPWIDKAIEAVGGAVLLQRIDGFTAVADLRAENAPPTNETLSVRRTPLRIERQRRLLDETILTSVDGDTATETFGTQKAAMTNNDVGILRREIGRHPIMLLAACARGELRFRPVAQRTVGDREMMILEAVGGPFDRLRVHIDSVSQLIRVVEAWETTSEGAFVHVSEAWSDYRGAAGLRVPYRRITEIDDGKNRVEAVYTSWQATWAQR